MIHEMASMTREQVADVAVQALALFPTASMEQHGPHLPIRTDTALALEVIDRAMQKVRAPRPIVVLPPLHFGSSHHHLSYAGVLSLTSDTYMRAVRDICEGLITQGFRRILIVNGHGGNTAPNAVVQRDLDVKYDVKVLAFPYWDLDMEGLKDVIPEGFGSIPGHAGDFETSLMLSALPEQVSHNLSDIIRLIEESAAEAGGAPRFGIGSPAGVRHLGFTDDTRHASAEIGNNLLDKAASALAGLIESEFAA